MTPEDRLREIAERPIGNQYGHAGACEAGADALAITREIAESLSVADAFGKLERIRDRCVRLHQREKKETT